MDSIREEFFPRSDLQKKEVREVAARGVSRVQRRACALKKTEGKVLRGGLFPPQKKEIWEVSARGVSRVQRRKCPKKRPSIKSSPEKFPPAKSPKKQMSVRSTLQCTAVEIPQKGGVPKKTQKKNFPVSKPAKMKKIKNKKKQQKGKKPKKKVENPVLKALYALLYVAN
jgi:hypothetical protein